MASAMDAMRSAMPGATAALVARVFDLMEVAEEELVAAAKRWPGAARRDAFKGAFLALCAPPQLTGRDPRVYRAHARELLDRMAAWSGRRGRAEPAGLLQEGTDAQVLVALLDTSLKSPLRRDHQALAERLFAQVFGREEAARLGLRDPIESYAGACEEIRVEARRALADPGRKRGKS